MRKALHHGWPCITHGTTGSPRNPARSSAPEFYTSIGAGCTVGGAAVGGVVGHEIGERQDEKKAYCGVLWMLVNRSEFMLVR